MKKHDEGYALVLVVVVMAVLMLVALSVLSLSLRNLQSQQASIERMQAKYAAQGEIEKKQAELESLTGLDLGKAQDILGKPVTENNGIIECDFSVTATNKAGTVSCTITCVIVLNEIKVNDEVKGVSVTYTSYTISTAEVTPALTGGEPG